MTAGKEIRGLNMCLLSQFEYERERKARLKVSRFWNSELNLNIFVMFEGKAKEFWHPVFTRL